jgi:hypothetical protein
MMGSQLHRVPLQSHFEDEFGVAEETDLFGDHDFLAIDMVGEAFHFAVAASDVACPLRGKLRFGQFRPMSGPAWTL